MHHPRVKLISDATPIEKLERLSDHLGVDLWIKRDDLAGTTLGGNKSRQLEFYLGAAKAAEADTILITGAVQSNFVRTAAASAAKCGMRTIVQLEDRVSGQDETYASSGNVLLNALMGAEIMRYSVGDDEAGADAALRARAETEMEKGYRPYVIPLALGNKPLGALGYVRAANEILSQIPEGFDFIVVASGSGLTHAGLLTGIVRAGSTANVIGSCVRRDAGQQTARITRVLADVNGLFEDDVAVPGSRINIWDDALNPGYGQVGSVAVAAMTLMTEYEGLLLDPVYTAKAFAAVPALIEEGSIPPGARVLFVHTGGLASLFAYQGALASMSGA